MSLSTIPDQPSNLENKSDLVEASGSDENPYDLQINGVQIDNSRDVYFGDKNEFHGPLNIEDLKQRDSGESDTKTNSNCDKNEEVISNNIAPNKGYIWLQNVPKYNSSLLGISLGMIILFIILLVTLLCLKQGTRNESKFRIVTKKEWQGNPPTNKTTPLVTPVPYVIIHHTATENCSTLAECASHLRAIQAFHVNSRAWYDIGYNFMVGGDGLVYEGRGWTEEGAHTLGVNFKSIGIAFIGTFIQIAPPVQQLQACKDLIKLGIELNYIKKDYHLFGAKQFYGTESPGTALMTEIKTWDRWAKIPNVTYT